MSEPGSKFCKRCDQWLPRSEFHRKRDAKDGLSSCCKPCAIAKSAAWNRANPGRATESARKLRHANPERSREQKRAYAAANREAIAANKRAWLTKNREAHLAKVLAWQRAHPEKMQAHYHAKRARRAAAPVGEVDLGALSADVCNICDEPIVAGLRWPDPLSKSLDHIIPLSRGGAHEQSNLAWTHLTCNLRKGARMPDDQKAAG